MGALKLSYNEHNISVNDSDYSFLMVVAKDGKSITPSLNSYVFGSPMPGRQFNGNDYRYGMNTQEKDNEITGNVGTHTSAEYWEYDTRLGRRWNTDPKPFVGISDYACFTNNPILFSDPNGDVVDYGKVGKGFFRNWINAKIAKNFGRGHNEFAKKFKEQWEDPKDKVFVLRHSTDFGKNQRLADAEVDEGNVINGIQDNAVYYNSVGGLGGLLGLERRTKWVTVSNNGNSESVTNVSDKNVVPGSSMIIGTYGHPDYLNISTDAGPIISGAIYNGPKDAYENEELSTSQIGQIPNNAFYNITNYTESTIKLSNGKTRKGLILSVPNSSTILNITVSSKYDFHYKSTKATRNDPNSEWDISYQKYRSVFKYKWFKN